MALEKSAKQESTELVSPSKVGFWDTTAGKSVKTSIYIGISALLTAIVNEATNNPTFLGEYTTLAIFFINNVGLVLLRNLFDPEVKNI